MQSNRMEIFLLKMAPFTYCLAIKVKNVLHLDVFLQSGGKKMIIHDSFIKIFTFPYNVIMSKIPSPPMRRMSL